MTIFLIISLDIPFPYLLYLVKTFKCNTDGIDNRYQILLLLLRVLTERICCCCFHAPLRSGAVYHFSTKFVMNRVYCLREVVRLKNWSSMQAERTPPLCCHQQLVPLKIKTANVQGREKITCVSYFSFDEFT